MVVKKVYYCELRSKCSSVRHEKPFGVMPTISDVLQKLGMGKKEIVSFYSDEIKVLINCHFENAFFKSIIQRPVINNNYLYFLVI